MTSWCIDWNNIKFVSDNNDNRFFFFLFDGVYLRHVGKNATDRMHFRYRHTDHHVGFRVSFPRRLWTLPPVFFRRLVHDFLRDFEKDFFSLEMIF